MLYLWCMVRVKLVVIKCRLTLAYNTTDPSEVLTCDRKSLMGTVRQARSLRKSRRRFRPPERPSIWRLALPRKTRASRLKVSKRSPCDATFAAAVDG